MSSVTSPSFPLTPTSGRFRANPKQYSGLRIVVSGQSIVNSLLLTYVAMTPLLVIPVAGLLGASDVLFFPTIAAVMLVGRLRECTVAHLVLAVFLILIGISLHQTREFTYVVKWVRLIGIALPFFLASFATVSLRQVVRVFFWSGFFAITIGIALWWFDIVLFADEANQRLWVESGESRIRAAGLFGNSGAFGALIAMWTIACGILTISDERPSKLFLATVLFTAIFGLMASTSRAALIAIIAGLGMGAVCFLYMRIQRRGLRVTGSAISLVIFAIVVAAAALCLVAPTLIDPEWLNATYSRFDPRSHQSSNSFLSGRLTIWEDYLATTDKWGIFGVGYKQGHLHFTSSPHNQFLSLAAESGIPSLFAFVLFIFTIFAMAIRRWRLKPFESIMCVAVMSGFIADGMGGEPLGSWQVTPITMILLGTCISSRHQRRS